MLAVPPAAGQLIDQLHRHRPSEDLAEWPLTAGDAYWAAAERPQRQKSAPVAAMSGYCEQRI
jgi:hypothetical protein